MKFFSKRKKFLVLIIGILVVLSLNFFQKEVKGFFYFISSPIQKSFWEAGGNAADFFNGIFQGGNFKKENEELKLRIQELLAENASFSELREENEILRKALEIGLQKEFRLALAEVIGKDIGQDSVLVNLGSQDGISEGMPVITQEKVLLGSITAVYERYCYVRLISNKESSFDAEISDSDVAGIVKGQGGSKLLLDLIPQEKEVKTGQLVLSSSLGGIYPKGLLVGLTGKIKRSDIGPFQQAEILPFVEIKELKEVLIILNL